MMTSARPTFEVVWKSLVVPQTDDDLPSSAPTEITRYDRLAGARKQAAEILIGARRRGYEVFSMDRLYDDPYQWCLTNGEYVHFLSIRAQEPQT